MSDTGDSGIIEAFDEDQTGVRLVFEWSNDRFRHRVDRVVAGKVVGAWHSVESDGAATWPLSPPLQQLSIEPIEETPVAFGVGSAGVSYWSLAVSPIVWDDRPALCFDVALKIPSGSDLSPVQAVSTYARQQQPAMFLPCNDVAPAVFSEAGDRLQIRAVDLQGSPIRWAYLFA